MKFIFGSDTLFFIIEFSQGFGPKVSEEMHQFSPESFSRVS